MYIGAGGAGEPLNDGEHKAPRGWGTPEERALRDMSPSAGVMVRRGTPDQFFLGSVP